MPRVRDREKAIRFSSSILPPYLRRTKTLEELLPWLYMKGRLSRVATFHGARPSVSWTPAPPTAFVPQRRPPPEGIALRHSSAKRGSCWSRPFPDSGRATIRATWSVKSYPISVSEYYLDEIRN